MPTITVEHLRSEGPFRVASAHSLTVGDGGETVEGRITAVRGTGPYHIAVDIELDDADYALVQRSGVRQ
jgi:hypothetical protein